MVVAARGPLVTKIGRRPAEGALRFGGGGGGVSNAAHFAWVTASDRCRRRPFSGKVYPYGVAVRTGGRRRAVADTEDGGGVGGGVNNGGRVRPVSVA